MAWRTGVFVCQVSIHEVTSVSNPQVSCSPTVAISRRAHRKNRQERAKEHPQPPSEPSPADAFQIQVIRSARRKKTVSAKLLNWYSLEIRAPADIPDDELKRIIDNLAQKALERRGNMRDYASDDGLDRRAQLLNKQYFGDALEWRSIRFVNNQNSRFGSCTPGRGTIRISHRLAGVPDFVVDYVIMHEMAHLLQANHSKAFWELVYRYPRAERARGYLMALSLEDDLVESEGEA